MARNKSSVIFYVIIVLAFTGFLYKMFTDTLGFLTNILLSLAITAALFLIVYRFFFKQSSGNRSESNKYNQAVKQSRQKYGQDAKSDVKHAFKRQSAVKTNKRPLRKRPSHLRVIEGSKLNK